MRGWHWITSALLATVLQGNDYTAEIANGGLRARQEDRVSMRSERLYLSQKTIRVEYEFVNETTEMVETVVAFPWPGYRFSYAVGTFGPEMLRFSVTVDGTTIQHQTEVRAFLGAREITDQLRSLRIDAATFGGIGTSAGKKPWIDLKRLEQLKATGAVDKESGLPEWMTYVTHYWRQRFPPGRSVRIVHEYQPMGGGASYRPLSAIEKATPEITSNREWFVGRDFDSRESGCPDNAFVKAFLRRQQESEKDTTVQPGMGLPFNWVRYILTTANTWKGPIQEFELIVDRNHGELVTFCWDGTVEKIGPNRFRAAMKNFRPTRELTVYFVPPVQRK